MGVTCSVVVLSGQNLGGLTLLPGVYSFATSAELNGTLTLKDQDESKAQFIFQIGTTLTTGIGSSVISINGGANAWANGAVFWQVGTSATLGADSSFEGNILARSDITMHVDASISDGSALSQFGTVILDSNRITKGAGPLTKK
ncbi:MAG: ice-binding family protein [Phycisphaerae bacterium]